MNVKYDDWGWHTGGVFPADQPQINGFTHIGMYLVWLIKHDLSNPELHDGREVSEVKAGTITAHDLADAIDGKLTADDMAPEGKAFSDWYYSPEGNPAYLADWANTFRNQPNYTVGDTPDNYAKIERVIDARLEQWTAAGHDGSGSSAAEALCALERAAATSSRTRWVESWERLATPELRSWM